MSLSGKNVVLGVSGCIAAYKSAEIVSTLVKLGATVDVILTDNGAEFITPLTLESLSGRPVITNMFRREKSWEIEHISLAKKADILVIAPATANILAKARCGIADDMLTTTYVACNAPKLLVPAMNTAMYEDVTVKENMEVLSSRGVRFVMPVDGRLACGATGKGKMADPSVIVGEIEKIINAAGDYAGKRVLVTVGATEESIDGVRYLTNRSSGKMGSAIAERAAARGAAVTVIAANVSVDLPRVDKTVRVKTTDDLMEAVSANAPDSDVIIMAAAPCDYKPIRQFDNKIKSDTLRLELIKNIDVAQAVGKIKQDKIMVVFAAETENTVENARLKMKKKNADIVVANDVTQQGAGFGCDTNIVTIITKDECVSYPIMLKSEVADKILDCVLTVG